MQSIAITGANGYLGRHLSLALRAAGFEVLALCRGKAPGDVRTAPFVLGGPVPQDLFAGVSTLVHCAHDFSPLSLSESKQINIEGSRILFESARTAGVERLIFISSMAAFPECRSVYGQVKLAAEEIALSANAIVLRPGTIFGESPGGLFATLEKLAKLPVIPLPDGGRQLIYLVHIDDVIEAIEVLIRAQQLPSKLITIANSLPKSLKDILSALAARSNKRPLFVSVPSGAIYYPLKTIETLGLRLPARSDSIISLTHLNPISNVPTQPVAGLTCRPFLTN